MTLNNSYNMEDLAKVFQNILGDNHYSIDVYSNLNIEGNVVQGLMKPYRRPFKLSNIKAETVELTFEFYISVRKLQAKLDELATISKICGFRKGTFTSKGKTFNYHSFLDFATPANAPVTDFGDYTQVVVVTGTCLVAEPNGAMVSNDIRTTLTINPDTANELSGELEVLTYSFGPTNSPESPQMANSIVAQTFNKTQSYNYTYTILVLKNAISERLIKAARNIQPFGLNENVRIKDTFPAFTDEPFEVENNCVVVECAFVGQAGAFATIQLSLHDAISIDNLDD